MVLTTPTVLTKTHGKVSVLLNHTHTTWPSGGRMRDSLTYTMIRKYCLSILNLHDGLTCG